MVKFNVAELQKIPKHFQKAFSMEKIAHLLEYDWVCLTLLKKKYLKGSLPLKSYIFMVDGPC